MQNVELLLGTVISANQFSVYGAVADSCNESSKGVRASGKPDALDHFERMEIPTDLFCRRKIYQCTAARKPGARIAKIRTIVSRPEIFQTML